MKAAVYNGPSDISIMDMEIPKIRDDEILVKTIRIGICPTDIRYFLGLRKESTYDNELFTSGENTYGLSGHEVIGEVVSVGQKVKGFSPGDLVTHETFTYCGVCRYCRNGLVNLCEHKKDIARGYSEYFKVPAKFAYKFSRAVNPVYGAFAEPLAVVIHAVKKIKEDNLIVIGAGPMGLLISFYARFKGKDVSIIELKENRIRFAGSLGFNVVNPEIASDSKALQEKFSDRIYGVISSVGGRGAIEQAIKLASDSAEVVIFGGTYPPDSLPLDLNSIHYSEKVITGSTDHTVEDMKESIDIIEKELIPLNRLVTREFQFTLLKEAFQVARTGDEMKIQITFE